MLEVVIFDDNKEYLEYLQEITNAVFESENIRGRISCASENEEMIKDTILKSEGNVFS